MYSIKRNFPWTWVESQTKPYPGQTGLEKGRSLHLSSLCSPEKCSHWPDNMPRHDYEEDAIVIHLCSWFSLQRWWNNKLLICWALSNLRRYFFKYEILKPTLLQSASSDLSGQSLALSHLQSEIDKRLDVLSHLLRMSMQKPLSQENSEELQELRARERICGENLWKLGNLLGHLLLSAACHVSLHLPIMCTWCRLKHLFSPGMKNDSPITKVGMAAWDTARSWGSLATVKFHWERIGSKIILEWRCPECDGRSILESHIYTLIRCEITPVYVIIPVCLSLRMAKEVSKLVLKRSGKLIKEELFLDLPCAKAPQLHRPWSLDGTWYRAGSAGLAAKSKWPMQCVWGDGFPTFLVRSLPSCS